MVEELPVGYYLDNFNYVLDFVTAQYRDLLTPAETAFANGFQDLSLDAQRLYVRLAGRKGPLFRDDKLGYEEIDVAAAVESLAAAGYLDFASDAALSELLALYTRDELVALAGDSVPRSIARAALLEHLEASLPPQEVQAQAAFRILRPLQLATLQTYKLLFFGNNRQDFTEFVLRDLGISPYEAYTIHPEDRFFDERAILEDTLRLYELGERAGEAIEANDMDAMIDVAAAVDDVGSDSLARRGHRIRNRIARQFERLDMPERALALYRRCTVAPSRERQARILHKQGSIEQAVALCRDIVADPEDEAEYEFGASFARRLLRRNGEDLDGFPELRTDGFRVREIEVVRQPPINVEELARLWFEERGDGAWYVENGLFPGLFGLAFWDVIFTPRKGVFFNPFQRGPADLFSPDFRGALGPAIRDRLAELADPDNFRRRVLSTFRAKQPVANWFVNWHLLSEPLLVAVFERVPAADILAVFGRLLRDLRNNRSGFPDLVVFPRAGSYLLAEVKGPGDALQNNQKRWLRFFGREGIPAEVVNVGWADT